MLTCKFSSQFVMYFILSTENNNKRGKEKNETEQKNTQSHGMF